jgi:hypothetical protein
MPFADFAMQRKVPTRLIWMIRLKASSGKWVGWPVFLSRPAVFTALPVPAQFDALLAVRRAGLGEGRIDLGVRGDIGLAEHAADFLGNGFALLHVEVEDGDLYALSSERARGGCAEAGGAAGDDRGKR